MMKHGKRTLRALLMSLGIGAAAASGALAQGRGVCDAEIIPDTDWRIQYDPHGTATTSYPFQLKVTNNGALDCNGRIRITTQNNLALLENMASRQTVRYSLTDKRTNFDVTPPEASSRPFAATLRVDGGGIAVNEYQVTVYPEGDLGSGQFIQYVTFDYVTPNSKEVLASRTPPIIYEVRASARIGLKGEYTRVGGMRTIELGELEDRNYSPRTVVTVDSTRGYQLSVTSENLGRLVHDDPVWSLPYRMTMAGQNIDLSRRHLITRQSNKALNDEYPLTFSVTGTDSKRAGRYSDVLHFTVTAI